MKNAYLVVSDLHLNAKKESRHNYLGEVVDSLDQINEIKERYKREGYNVILLLLGDVVDRSIANADSAMLVQNILRYFCKCFDEVYSVVGNHEVTYSTANPFWHLVRELTAPSLAKLYNAIQTKGLEAVITVPEKIIDGNTVFYFNHNSTPTIVPSTAEGEIHIGLFHQAVGSNDICKMWGTFTNVEEAAFVSQYNYSFFGHMHMAYGKYWLNDAHTSQGIWLGTIGRCTVPEVIETPLTRNVPAVLVEDGRFVRVEDNDITLTAAATAVDFNKYEAEKKTREVLKERQSIRSYQDGSLSMFECIRRSCVANDLQGVFDMCAKGSDVAVFNYKSYCSGSTLI